MALPLYSSSVGQSTRASRRSSPGTVMVAPVSSRPLTVPRRWSTNGSPQQQCNANKLERMGSGGMSHNAIAYAEASVRAVEFESSTSWPAFPSFYQWGEMLGEGSFGKVRVATDTRTGEQYAVKIVAKRLDGRDRTKNIQDEVSIWARLNSSTNVTTLHGVYQDASSVYLVQELCYGGDLQTLMDAQEILSEQEAAQAATGILSTLAECHSMGICYGDVKPANFLIKSMYPSLQHIIDPSQSKGSLELRTADFGCSQQCDDDTPCLTKLSGTPIYLAPEVLLGDGYNMSADVWSVGVMLYQMITNKFPFWDIDTPYIQAIPVEQIFDDIMSADVIPSDMISEDAADLLSKMLTRDVKQRISARQALEHPWFQKMLHHMQ